MLRAVSDRENDRVIRGEAEFTYDEYLRAAKASATIYNENTGGKRSVNMTQDTVSNVGCNRYSHVRSSISSWFIVILCPTLLHLLSVFEPCYLWIVSAFESLTSPDGT